MKLFSARSILCLALALLALGTAACGSECSSCSSDSDCDQGQTCASFEGGHHLCAKSDTSSCTVSY